MTSYYDYFQAQSIILILTRFVLILFCFISPKNMMNELIAQVLHLMQKQNEQNYFRNHPSNYAWISYKRSPTRLNSKDEVSIRLIAQKLTSEQCYNVIKQLKLWFEQEPNVEANEIPKMCLVLLNKEYNMSVVQTVTNKRAESFQQFLNSVRSFTPNFVLVLLQKIHVNNSG